MGCHIWIEIQHKSICYKKYATPLYLFGEMESRTSKRAHETKLKWQISAVVVWLHQETEGGLQGAVESCGEAWWGVCFVPKEEKSWRKGSERGRKKKGEGDTVQDANLNK